MKNAFLASGLISRTALFLAALALLAPARIFGQSSGPWVDECSSGTVDSSNSISQSSCVYGDEAGLDTYVYTEDDEYEDWGGGDFFVPDVGSEDQVTDGSSLVYDSGVVYGGTAVTATGTVTPNPYDWYTINGIYYECYDPTGDGYSCSWTWYWGQSVAVQVTPSATLSVSSSASSSTPGQSVTFTATVSSGPTGTVTFYDSGSSIGSGTISGTTASFTTNLLTLGDHVITAYWPGNSTYPAVTSSAIVQVVYQSGPIQLPGGTDINTLAGNGTASFSGDSGPALIAELYYPTGVALDSSGNIYFADHDNERVRMVNPTTGTITTVAGNGTAGYSGDGGSATSAELYYPEGVAVDASGALYIADLGNNVVRKVILSTGVISTAAGTGTQGFSGDGGLAASAKLYEPFNVAVDTYGNLYIADWGNCRIRKVTRATSDISTVAGNGTCGYAGDGGSASSAELNYPTDVALDSPGNLYIVDAQNNRIREVAAAGGAISTVAGTGTAGYSGDTGTATSAKLNSPFGIAVDGAGDLFISDEGNGRIREVFASTSNISTIAGDGTTGYYGDGGPAVSAELYGPFGVAVDAAGNLYVADVGNQRIRIVGTSRTNSALTVTTSSTPTASGSLVTFTAVTSTGGGTAPTGTTTFFDGSTGIGQGSISSISATNLVPYSQQFGNSAWSGYCGSTSNMTVNSAATTAPDGTNTATQFVLPSSYSCGSTTSWGALTSITGGLTVGQTYTTSIWLRGASGGESVNFGLNDCATVNVTLTTQWIRYTASWAVSSAIAGCEAGYGVRGFEVVGWNANGAYYAWGAQTEQASTAGPYIATGASAQTGYGGVATFSTNLLSPGTHTISSSWPGDANYRSATSNQISQAIVAQTAPTITWSNPSAISYGTALSGTQLDASASVGGTFVYTPESGEILTPGTHELSVTFFPTDSGDYATVTATVNLTVNTSSTPETTVYSYCITTLLGSDCPSSPSGYAANSTVQAYTDSVNGTWSSIGYDSLNRLTSAQSTAGYYASGGSLQVNWTYDDFGNRTGQTYSGSSTVSLPTATSTTYNANNQVSGTSLMLGAPLGYDASGDVTLDNNNQYLYDGDGRICAVKNLYSGSMTEYIYDAEGTRVAKGSISSWSCDSTSNGFSVTNSYVLGPGNEQLTEMAISSGSLQWAHTNVFAAGGLIATYDQDTASDSQVLHFQFADWLGSRRVQTDYAGNTEEACTSLPFGDGLNCPLTSVSTADDATEHHFTGKERDTESGLDYFGARYYGSSMGRWMSPDWAAKVAPVPYAVLADPQSLNLYSYVRNNPLNRADADGHCDAPSNLKAGQVGICVASYISSKSFDKVGDGDNRGTNGKGGTSRIQTTFTIDPTTGKTDKDKDSVAKSTLMGGHLAAQGTGSSQISPTATPDSDGNLHLSVNQSAQSAYDKLGVLGDISNHVNLEVTPSGQVGVEAGSTARQFPALEIYRYTTDGTTVTTTLVHNYQETNPSALRQPEQPLTPQAPQ